ncbi:S-layer homology domain-containing protein [Paenibacillus koleovorans]|uniref:S-layer homology domain-containing protein n=1 Tax=Paenibacillus koleovorans TaxID=121608 RepID=UPI000FDAF110|nr:S-layer homology domain-containing protein [Paenibacillus koleovorans]
MTRNRTLRNTLTLLLGCALVTGGLWMPAALAEEKPTFVLQQIDEPTGTTGEVRLSVSGQHLTDLYAYELHLAYDPLRLKLKRAETDIPGFTVLPKEQENRITFAHTKVGGVPGENGDLTLGELTFETIGDGVAKVSLLDVQLVNSRLTMTTHAVSAGVLIGSAPTLTDIEGHWAEDSIRKAAALGLADGYEDRTFRPQNPISRAEFAALLVRAMELPFGKETASTFADDSRIPAWAKKYVAAAVRANLLSGYEDRTFRADNLLSRPEMAAIMVRATGMPVSPEAVPEFADVADIPSWSRPNVAAGAKAGLIDGKDNGLFAPNEHTTRAEAITIILRLLDKLDQQQ